MGEEWRDIIGYVGYYQVSNLGRVRGLNRSVKHYFGGPKKVKQKIMRTYKNKGYINVALNKDGKQKHFSIHRLIALHFISNEHNKPHINHINGIKHDNRIENLEWCTRSENLKHAVKSGLYKRPNVKLRDKEVRKIRRLHKEGLSQLSIANKYNVDPSTISDVVNYKTHKGVL